MHVNLNTYIHIKTYMHKLTLSHTTHKHIHTNAPKHTHTQKCTHIYLTIIFRHQSKTRIFRLQILQYIHIQTHIWITLQMHKTDTQPNTYRHTDKCTPIKTHIHTQIYTQMHVHNQIHFSPSSSLGTKAGLGYFLSKYSNIYTES